jgi:hypothetical protein
MRPTKKIEITMISQRQILIDAMKTRKMPMITLAKYEMTFMMSFLTLFSVIG